MISAPAPDELVQRSRALGARADLVVYGGGNTSTKGEITDHLGRRHRVMWVKGSGADMADAGAEDYPALRLDELLPLRDRGDMSDEVMTDLVARALVDPASRRPSIETLLHAFLPQRHVDHVHADAVCALTNHAAGPEITREALGGSFAYVDWLRPGFRLSAVVGELAHYEGVVLAHHGLVTWDVDSDACLARTLAAVETARAFAAAHRLVPGEPTTAPPHHDIPDDELDRLLLHLRGELSRTGRRLVRVDRRLRAVADRADAAIVVAAGVSSADHMLRIRPWSALVATGATHGGHVAAEAVRRSVADHRDTYESYVARHIAELPAGTPAHDSAPVVTLVPGLGAVTTGRTLREAEVAADIALRTHGVAAAVADAFGPPEPLPEAEVFGFDYWPIELYKLRTRSAPAAFAGRVVMVTGAASGIGRAVAHHLARQGAAVVLADIDADTLDDVAVMIAADSAVAPLTVTGDQSDEDVVAAGLSAAVRRFGGIDGVVLNAGIAMAGRLDELSVQDWDRALRVNSTSAFLLTRHAMRAMREQRLGGSLVYVVSKNALSPGAGFGAYSASKAAQLQLMRIAALEGGPDGIRANAVNPDAVFDTRLWDDGLRKDRARAHGVAPAELPYFYAARTLLGVQVTSADVAAAVAFLLSDASSRTTGAILPVDGGVAAAFPR